MVVVLPAPLGPSRPKHSPAADLQVQPGDGHHVAVALLQPAADDSRADSRPGHDWHSSHGCDRLRFC